MNSINAVTHPLLTLLKRLNDNGVIRPLDYQFATFIAAKEPMYSDKLGFMAGVLSSELGRGNVCILLERLNHRQGLFELARHFGFYGSAALEFVELLIDEPWLTYIENAHSVSKIDSAYQNGDRNAFVEPIFVKPMVFNEERLYLHRYWHYESTLAQRLQALSVPVKLNTDEMKRFTLMLGDLFGKDDSVSSEPNWQKVAAAVALTQRFTVISGGPGTGKTTTVTKILAALVEQYRINDKIPIIKLVAPTGKAAARLTQSIGLAIESLPCLTSVKAVIPTQSSTLHGLLGALPNQAEFRHHRGNPLHADIIVVDEASMIDLPMMFKLVDALPKQARIILLGDKDQLSSVEAGAVLGDICSFGQMGYSSRQTKVIEQLAGGNLDGINSTYQNNADMAEQRSPIRNESIADGLCELKKSYRFDSLSGIGRLAKIVNQGLSEQVEKLFNGEFADIIFHPIRSGVDRLDGIDTEVTNEVANKEAAGYQHLIDSLVDQYQSYLERLDLEVIDPKTKLIETNEEKAKAVLACFNRCRLLCAVRDGEDGVKELNRRIEMALFAKTRQRKEYLRAEEQDNHFISKRIVLNRLISKQSIWYAGRPIMVTRNNHKLKIYNGDIGICMVDSSNGREQLKVYFEQPDGRIRAILPNFVPEHETAYAMTIHKSQGSEFDTTMMILPLKDSPILTRELIYTGITRAKKQFILYADIQILKRAINRRTSRNSGLVKRLMSIV